jgi:putative restriction endonuclease
MDEIAEFDAPVFKVLSKNDSGEGDNNQAGPLIPRDLWQFFPPLAIDDAATTGVTISAILIVEEKEVARVETRYQIQTRKNQRKGERRITGNLGALRDQSSEGDIVLIERNIVDRSLYRLTLLKQGSAGHSAVLKAANGLHWGPLDRQNPPVPDAAIVNAEVEQKEREKKPFDMFDVNAAITLSQTKKVARSRAFQKLTTDYYDGKCALCGEGLKAANGKTETEAAHIVPRGRFGADDARNGIALCRSHHWAFDKGMWGVAADGTVVIATAITELAENAHLVEYGGAGLKEPSDPAVAPAPEALAWHIDNIVNKITA